MISHFSDSARNKPNVKKIIDINSSGDRKRVQSVSGSDADAEADSDDTKPTKHSQKSRKKKSKQARVDDIAEEKVHHPAHCLDNHILGHITHTRLTFSCCV
jgi:hypothetical protein